MSLDNLNVAVYIGSLVTASYSKVTDNSSIPATFMNSNSLNRCMMTKSGIPLQPTMGYLPEQTHMLLEGPRLTPGNPDQDALALCNQPRAHSPHEPNVLEEDTISSSQEDFVNSPASANQEGSSFSGTTYEENFQSSLTREQVPSITLFYVCSYVYVDN